ncbi:SDR family oxidoreductase [Rubellimicrobium arenae]|uniref:SDR family oxidoreductase n=1 Tax=Rubellimicrobium arenae TaxID=2817372 RepID=UPI001B3065C1|nr:SDR family oxidoreductase [Rubellimicrobium arenae]
MRIAGRTGVVTGVDGPIGAAIARGLVAAGVRLSVEAADKTLARSIAAGIGADPVSAGWAEETSPDILVDAAPLPAMGPRLSEAGAWEDALLASGRALSRAATCAARMPRDGAILVVSALPAALPMAGWLVPLLAWREAAVATLARELAPQGIRVNGLAPVLGTGGRLPGFLQRGAASAPATPLSRAATPPEVAQAALWLLETDLVTGLTLPLDGGRRL